MGCHSGQPDAKQPAGAMPSAIVDQYQGAISKRLVLDLYIYLNTAYDGLGRSSTRQAWLIGGAVTITATALEQLYGAGSALATSLADWTGFYSLDLPEWGHIIGLVIAGVPLMATVYGAGLWGRHAVRGVIGKLALRKPSQGILPFAIALAALGVHIRGC